jgi:Tol biopolymer transport system component
LTDPPAADLQPDWSRDGKLVTLASERDGNLEIYTVGADEG